MKVLKIAAIVVGAVALAATGVGLAAGFTLGATLGAIGGVAGAIGLSGLAATAFTGLIAGAALYTLGQGLSLVEGLFPKPSQGGSQTKWKADPYAGLPYPMGRTLVSGNIVYRRGHGDSNKFQTFVTVLGICTAASIDTTFMNKSTVTFDGAGNATGTYRNQIYQRTQLGACPEPAALVPPIGAPTGWTPSHKLSGLSAVMNTFVYDAKDTNGLTAEPAPGWIGHWVKVYDPRLDSTYPGGSGPCRALQEDTYVWSENPHLHGLTWTLGRYHNGKRVAGIGGSQFVDRAKITGVDIASFVEGANLDDARGWTIGGQVVTRPDTLWNSLKLMLQAGGAQPALIGGVITSINRAPRVSLATITRDDIVGKCTFAGTQRRRTRINGIIPSYRSEAHDWEIVPADIVQVADFVTLDGDERTQDATYQLVQNVNQASQLAIYDIYDAREAGPGTIPLKPWWLNYKVGDCVTFEPEDDLAIKVLITGRAVEAQSGVITYTVAGETDGKHAYALGQTGVAPPIASLIYDPSVPLPGADDWALVGATLADNGAKLPILSLTGAVGIPSADAVVFDSRPYVSDQADFLNWRGLSIDAPSTTHKEFAGVTPGTQYQVGVRYRVRGVVGERLILGPVTAGELGIDWSGVGGTGKPEDNATVGAPAGTHVGGVPAEVVIDALYELVSTGDPEKIIDGATALVDRLRQAQLTQLTSQLLAETRNQRINELTHLNGTWIGARVRTEIQERQDAVSALAQQIIDVAAGITGPDGPIQAAVTQLLQAAADEAQARAVALEQLDADITGPSGAIAAAVTQLAQAISTEQQARAEQFTQLTASIKTNSDAIDASFTTLSQAVADANEARVQGDTDLAAQITGPDGPIAAAVSQFTLALANQQEAVAQTISDLTASITGPNGAIAASETRLNQAIAAETGPIVTDLTTLRSRVGNSESTITFLMEAVNGDQSIVQLSTTVDTDGVRKVTGFKINGQESEFVIAADKFVVGDSRIFQVDTTTGVVTILNAVIGNATILSGNIAGSAVMQSRFWQTQTVVTVS